MDAEGRCLCTFASLLQVLSRLLNNSSARRMMVFHDEKKVNNGKSSLPLKYPSKSNPKS